MNSTKRRIIGYGLASLVTSGLVYGGFFYKADVDLLTLLSSVDIQIRVAGMMPEKGKDGLPSVERRAVLDRVRGLLAQIEARDSDLLPAREYSAYLELLSGNYPRAARLYKKALHHEGVTPQIHDIFVLNRAMALRMAGRKEKALAVLEAAQGSFTKENQGSLDLERARLLGWLGRDEEACGAALRVVEPEATPPMVRVKAGRFLESRGRLVQAEEIYQAAVKKLPIAQYWLARLKVRAGEFDRALALLERAAQSAGRPRVRKLLRQDATLWQPLAGDGRFKSLVSSGESAARPGR